VLEKETVKVKDLTRTLFGLVASGMIEVFLGEAYPVIYFLVLFFCFLKSSMSSSRLFAVSHTVGEPKTLLHQLIVLSNSIRAKTTKIRVGGSSTIIMFNGKANAKVAVGNSHNINAPNRNMRTGNIIA